MESCESMGILGGERESESSDRRATQGNIYKQVMVEITGQNPVTSIPEASTVSRPPRQIISVLRIPKQTASLFDADDRVGD